MGRPRDDFDLLLEAPHPVEAELARGMLADAGIPVLVHGGDFDVAELGSATHAMLRRPDVYVPKGMKGRAEEVLREAGYSEGADEASPRLDTPSARANRRRWAIAFLLLLVGPAIVIYAIVAFELFA
jgi:hypothetical protein